MKDPLDSRKRAYEVLGLTPQATMADVQQAYVDLSGDPKNRKRHQEITDAWRRLRRSDSRIEEDFWHYQADTPENAQYDGQVPVEPPAIQPAFPPITLGREFTDLHQGRAARFRTPIKFRDVTLSYLRRFFDAPVLPKHVRFDS